MKILCKSTGHPEIHGEDEEFVLKTKDPIYKYVRGILNLGADSVDVDCGDCVYYYKEVKEN